MYFWHLMPSEYFHRCRSDRCRALLAGKLLFRSVWSGLGHRSVIMKKIVIMWRRLPKTIRNYHLSIDFITFFIIIIFTCYWITCILHIFRASEWLKLLRIINHQRKLQGLTTPCYIKQHTKSCRCLYAQT